VDERDLASYPLFASLSKQERETVGRYLDQIDVRAGRVLAGQGDFAHEFFVIESGEATVERDGQPLGTLRAGDFFGEIALVETDRRTATVRAETDMRLLVMHQRDFASMVVQSPAIAERLREAAHARLEA
jgi:CRP-like cAMP-binding protein